MNIDENNKKLTNSKIEEKTFDYKLEFYYYYFYIIQYLKGRNDEK